MIPTSSNDKESSDLMGPTINTTTPADTKSMPAEMPSSVQEENDDVGESVIFSDKVAATKSIKKRSNNAHDIDVMDRNMEVLTNFKRRKTTSKGGDERKTTKRKEDQLQSSLSEKKDQDKKKKKKKKKDKRDFFDALFA